MKKLTLILDELEVESFEAEATPAQTGTVAAHELTPLCQQTYDPHLAWCVFSDANPNSDCTPVCYTGAYECTVYPEYCF